MRKLQIVCFLVAAIVICGAIAYRIAYCEDIIRNGVEYRVRVEGYDPYDPMRGRYLAVRLALPDYRLTEAECAAFNVTSPGYVYNHIDRAYAVLTRDDDGFAEIAAISPAPPTDSTDFVEVTGTIANGSYHMSRDGDDDGEQDDNAPKFSARFDTNRYYINETLANQLERDHFRVEEEDNNTVAVLRVLNGKHIVTGLLVNGLPLEQIGLATEQ